jgi:hypothetical protein
MCAIPAIATGLRQLVATLTTKLVSGIGATTVHAELGWWCTGGGGARGIGWHREAFGRQHRFLLCGRQEGLCLRCRCFGKAFQMPQLSIVLEEAYSIANDNAMTWSMIRRSGICS